MKITRIFDLLTQYQEKYSFKTDAFNYKINGAWISYSTSEYIEYSNKLSAGLLALGVKKGDKIATISNNRPEWNFIDMAIMQIGAIQIPIYPTISDLNYKYILEDAGISMVIVSGKGIYDKIKYIFKEISTIKEIYSIDPIDDLKTWIDILKAGEESYNISRIEEIKSSIKETDIATIIYTSGTTGDPKGVMLSHSNIISNFLEVSKIPDFNYNHRALSFLPLCHVYERMINYMYQYFGISIYYAESIETIAENIKECRPHIFCAVPRVIEKFYDKIVSKGRNLRGIERIIFFWALKLSHHYEKPQHQSLLYKLEHKIADYLVFRKWREALGGNIYMIVSGGAAIQPKLVRVFWAAGFKLMEGYGLTETSPVIAVGNLEPDGIKFGCIGKILPGVNVKLAEDGEILCKGPNVMLGYYNHQEATKNMIDDEGWLHTGDIGILEDGKYLKITDRKKEIFKTSGGKYITPQVLESVLLESHFIENVIVVGDNRKYAAAIIVPSFPFVKSWCRNKKIEYISDYDAVNNERIIKRIGKEIHKFNKHFDRTQKIKRFVLLDKEWSVESGELSPTLKLRRSYINEKFKDVIDKLYDESNIE